MVKLIDWLAEINPETLPPEINFNHVIFVVVTITLIAGIFIIIGSIFFIVGSRRVVTPTKIGEVKVAKKPKKEKAARKPVEKEIVSKPVSKKSKRDRRLKQIQKHSKGRKK